MTRIQDVALVQKYHRDHYSLRSTGAIVIRSGDIIVPSLGFSVPYIAKTNDVRLRSGDIVVRMTTLSYPVDLIIELIHGLKEKPRSIDQINQIVIPRIDAKTMEAITMVNDLIVKCEQQVRMLQGLKLSLIRPETKGSAK